LCEPLKTKLWFDWPKCDMCSKIGHISKTVSTGLLGHISYMPQITQNYSKSKIKLTCNEFWGDETVKNTENGEIYPGLKMFELWGKIFSQFWQLCDRIVINVQVLDYTPDLNGIVLLYIMIFFMEKLCFVWIQIKQIIHLILFIFQ